MMEGEILLNTLATGILGYNSQKKTRKSLRIDFEQLRIHQKNTGLNSPDYTLIVRYIYLYRGKKRDSLMGFLLMVTKCPCYNCYYVPVNEQNEVGSLIGIPGGDGLAIKF